MNKKKIYFVPLGISGIAYYERLIPRLKGKNNVGFLLLGYDTPPLRQMIAYCQNKQYAHHVISLGQKKGNGFRLPFFSPLAKMFAHKKKCHEFLEAVRPAKLIFDKTKKPFDTIAHEANNLGIETIRLQWSFLFTEDDSARRRLNTTSLLSRVYFRLVQCAYVGMIFLMGERKSLPQSGVITPQKLGVVDSEAERMLTKDFDTSPGRVHVVGTVEAQQMYELKEKTRSDELFKKNLEKKYAIDNTKINIIVLGFRLTRVVGATGKRSLSKDEHIACFKNIFEDIYTVFRKEEVNILFKMHKGDENVDMYDVYKSKGVSLHGESARLDELMCVSDLCVIDPWTTANFLVLASDIPAICVDFAPIQGRIVPKDNFKIKEIIQTQDGLLEKLRLFKEGKLEKQYDNKDIELRATEKIINLINL